jgi:hypothetical protein
VLRHVLVQGKLFMLSVSSVAQTPPPSCLIWPFGDLPLLDLVQPRGFISVYCTKRLTLSPIEYEALVQLFDQSALNKLAIVVFDEEGNIWGFHPVGAIRRCVQKQRGEAIIVAEFDVRLI